MRKIAKNSLTFLTLALLLCSCGNSSTPNNTNTSVSENSASEKISEKTETKVDDDSKDTATEKPKPKKGTKENPIKIGKKGKLNDWTITITKVQFLNKIPNGDYLAFEPEKGNKYLQVSMKIRNNAKSAETIFPSYSYGDGITTVVLYKDDYEFSATHLLGLSNELHDSTINPLSSKKGLLAYEVPKKVASSSKPLFLRLSSLDKDLYFKIR